MTILIEDQGQVSLYRDGARIYFTYNGWTRSLVGITWNFNSGSYDGIGWRVVAADFLELPNYISSDYPHEDLLVLWEREGDWQAMTFVVNNGFTIIIRLSICRFTV